MVKTKRKLARKKLLKKSAKSSALTRLHRRGEVRTDKGNKKNKTVRKDSFGETPPPTGQKSVYIAIAGNIGSGKTTLAEKLGKHYRWEVQYETPDENPYLTDFYQDMQRWAFNLQVYFLTSRYKKVLEIQKSRKSCIQDRTIYEDAYIFAPNLHAMGLMTKKDYDNFMNLFETIIPLIKPPSLLIYLRGSISALVNQIQKRGREYEDNIRLDYLKRLNERYEAWYESYNLGKKIVIQVDETDFSENPRDLGKVIHKINGTLFGLF